MVLLEVMPFQTDNAWPAGLLTIFEHGRARHSTFENCYHGPYNKLLNYCFGSKFTFYVAPQNPPASNSRDTVDFVVFLVVFNSDDKPVLIVEVKDDSWAQKAELHYRADNQMRDRYGLMLDDCPTPRLWSLSVLGTSVHVYCGDKASYDVILGSGYPSPRAFFARTFPIVPGRGVALRLAVTGGICEDEGNCD